MRLVIATHNPAKAGEMSVILRELLPGWDFLTLADFPGASEPEETGETYAENARIKAEAAAAFTGEVCIADDAGLEVDALYGAPGVRSKRFFGITPFAFKMVQILMAIEDDLAHRGPLGFDVALRLLSKGEDTRLFEAVKHGEIVEPRGERGFGYDPIFLVPELGKTYAELEPDHKNRISHRGMVLRQAAEYLTERWN